MSNKYKLLPNSKLVCVKIEDELCLFGRDDYLSPDNAILKLPAYEIIKIEEIPTENKEETYLLVVEYFVDVTNVSSILNNKITFYHLNVSTHAIYKAIPYFSAIEPQKISSKYYLYKNIINDPILIDKDSNTICLIEPELEEYFEITAPEFNCFDKAKNPSIYELEFDINNVERLHIYLKIDEEAKVHNVFYSEMKKGMPLTVYCPGDESEYLDVKIFYERLLNHPILDEIIKKEKSIRTTKKKIRKRAKEIFSNNE